MDQKPPISAGKLDKSKSKERRASSGRKDASPASQSKERVIETNKSESARSIRISSPGKKAPSHKSVSKERDTALNQSDSAT